jgi:cytochrome P460
MAIKGLAFFLVAVMLSSASSLFQIQSAAPNSFRFEAAELDDKTLWTQVNAEPYHVPTQLDALCRSPTADDYKGERERHGNPHIAPAIIVYVNNLGRQAMFANQPQFPEGSIIVKKKLGFYIQRDPPQLYTLMRKRETGYNPSVGDWEFLVFSGDGKQLQASGRLQNCQSCHVAKKDSDFVFRPYVKAVTTKSAG